MRWHEITIFERRWYWTYVGLGLSADEADFAVVAGPALPLEVVDQVCRVDPAGGVDRVSAAEAGDEGLGLANGVGLARAEALHANRQGGGALEKKVTDDTTMLTPENHGVA